MPGVLCVTLQKRFTTSTIVRSLGCSSDQGIYVFSIKDI